MSKFEIYFRSINGLSAGEKREAKPMLRFAFNTGRKGWSFDNVKSDPQWVRLGSSAQAAMLSHMVSAWRAGEEARS